LRTEEPEPESDSCIIRSRLPGALPKRRLRLASRLPSPRASLQASGTPTRSALEPEQDGASLASAPTSRTVPDKALLRQVTPVTSLDPALLRQVTPRPKLA